MTLAEVDRLSRGSIYSITVMEDGLNFTTVGNTYTAEFRGLDVEDAHILFWIEGSSNATPFHYQDIIQHSKIN